MHDLDAQKASAETQLGQLKSLNEELNTAFKELKSAKDRVTELESTAVKREQLLGLKPVPV